MVGNWSTLLWEMSWSFRWTDVRAWARGWECEKMMAMYVCGINALLNLFSL